MEGGEGERGRQTYLVMEHEHDPAREDNYTRIHVALLCIRAFVNK